MEEDLILALSHLLFPFSLHTGCLHEFYRFLAVPHRSKFSVVASRCACSLIYSISYYEIVSDAET
jgi:hypothetical protein